MVGSGWYNYVGVGVVVIGINILFAAEFYGVALPYTRI
jgi:hypothetical protein